LEVDDDSEFGRERRVLEPMGARSSIVVPVADELELVGFLGMDSVAAEIMWSDDHMAVLNSLAGIVSQALARSDAEQRFGLAFRHAPLGMALHGPDGQHLQVNEAYCELVGRSLAQVMAATSRELVHPGDEEKWRGRMHELSAGQRDIVVVECRYVRPDETERWVRVHSAAVRWPDGSLRYAVTHVEDITTRRLQEQELRTSEQRYRSLVENSPAIVMRFNRDYELTYISPSAAELPGLPIDEVIGSDRLLKLGQEGPRWRSAIEKVLETGRRYDREWQVELSNQTFWFQSRAVPEFDADGTIESVMVVNTDITAL